MNNPDTIILQMLLEDTTKFLSGTAVAKRLGISRVGVWSRLEKMREQGFDFEAVRHRGYRIRKEPETLSEALVKAYLGSFGHPTDLVLLDKVDSTNSEAERLLAHGRKGPFVVLAKQQEVGRGRFGRRWHSPNEGNCYISFAFRPELPPIRMQSFTLWMGYRICRFINEKYEIPVRLKWPNDLVLNGKKLGGMLTEARIDSDRMRDLIFGLGLNVNSDVGSWPEEFRKVAASMAVGNDANLQINRLAAELVVEGLQAYEAFINAEAAPEFVEDWKSFDALAGREIKASIGSREVHGVADGINELGELRMITGGDKLELVRAGEVSLGSNIVLNGRKN